MSGQCLPAADGAAAAAYECRAAANTPPPALGCGRCQLTFFELAGCLAAPNNLDRSVADVVAGACQRDGDAASWLVGDDNAEAGGAARATFFSDSFCGAVAASASVASDECVGVPNSAVGPGARSMALVCAPACAAPTAPPAPSAAASPSPSPSPSSTPASSPSRAPPTPSAAASPSPRANDPSPSPAVVIVRAVPTRAATPMPTRAATPMPTRAATPMPTRAAEPSFAAAPPAPAPYREAPAPYREAPPAVGAPPAPYSAPATGGAPAPYYKPAAGGVPFFAPVGSYRAPPPLFNGGVLYHFDEDDEHYRRRRHDHGHGHGHGNGNGRGNGGRDNGAHY
jgi:hypothetical protein